MKFAWHWVACVVTTDNAFSVAILDNVLLIGYLSSSYTLSSVSEDEGPCLCTVCVYGWLSLAWYVIKYSFFET